MENANEKVIHVLEKLIETCRDSQNGYRDAAEHTKSPQLRQFFNQQSIERAQFAGQLENEVIHLGDHNPERKGTVSGAIHRAWFDLKEKFSGNEESILNSVESGEDTAKHEFEQALQEGHLPVNIYTIVRQQATHVVAAHDRVRELRDERKKAA
jgi:uncharacterized protein (TIGR02284 family)